MIFLKIGKTLTWEHINTFTSFFSFIGPRRNKKKFNIVKLLASRMIPVFGCNVSSVSPNAENKWRTNVVSLEGGVRKSAFDGCRRLVFASNLSRKKKRKIFSEMSCIKKSNHPANLGTLCRGHGTSPNNCGQDRRKLKI